MASPINVINHRHDDRHISSPWSHLVYDMAGGSSLFTGHVAPDGPLSKTGTVLMSSGSIYVEFGVRILKNGEPGRIQTATFHSSSDDATLLEMSNVRVPFGKVEKAVNAIHDDIVARGWPEFATDMPAIIAPFAARPINARGTNGNLEELAGGPQDDVIRGRGGEDVVLGTAGADDIDGGGGTGDMIDYTLLNAMLGLTGKGTGLIADLNAGFAKLPDGTRQTIKGFEGIVGLDAKDVLKGGDADDFIIGNYGGDRLIGRGGDDEIFGDAGADTVLGGAGDDMIGGGDGADRLRGQGGDDVLFADAGADQAFGNAGGDMLDGGDGADTLKGGAGADTVTGGAGADLIQGQAGADSLEGGDDDDRLEGGTGNDTLTGGAGDNDVFGGAGADVFLLGVDGGIDTVKDFDGSVDRFDLSGGFGFDDLLFNDVSGGAEIYVIGLGLVAEVEGATAAGLNDAGLFV